MPYRWLAYDLVSGAALAELPLSLPKYGGVLGGAGPFSASMTVPSDDTTLAALLMTATTPERTIVYPERNGVLVGDGGYIIWSRVAKASEPVRLVGASLASYLRRNRIVSTLTYAAADQLSIARGLVDHLQAQPGGDVGITVGSETCGVTRDRTYWAYERKNVGDALAQLAAVDNGFEWAIDLAWSTDAEPVPVKTLRLSYPRRGRVAADTGLILELGKNIVNYERLEDGTRSARVVDAVGAGDGTDMLLSTAARTDLLDAGYPLTAETLAYKDVSVQATLDAHALNAVAARAATPTFVTVWVDADDPESGIGQWVTGDEVRLRITDHQFPVTSAGRPGLEGVFRIVAYEAEPTDNGTEIVKLILST